MVYLVKKYPNINFYNYDCLLYCASESNIAEIINEPNLKTTTNQIQNKANSSLLDNIAESNDAFENNFQNHESTIQEVSETELNMDHFLSEIIDNILSKMFF